MKIRVEQRRINDTRVGYVFVLNEKEYSTITELIEDNFADQGDFYEKALGVSYWDAEIAGWCPDFQVGSDGWAQMLRDSGEIHTNIKAADIQLKEIIQRKDLSDFFPESQE